jgi:hypothetical protein
MSRSEPAGGESGRGEGRRVRGQRASLDEQRGGAVRESDVDEQGGAGLSLNAEAATSDEGERGKKQAEPRRRYTRRTAHPYGA